MSEGPQWDERASDRPAHGGNQMRGPLLLCALVTAALIHSSPSVARVGTSAWCLWDTEGEIECLYATQRQCLITARGRGGVCYPNEYYHPARRHQPRRNG